MSTTHIFNKDLQKLVSLNYELEVFKAQPTLCYPKWTSDMYATETLFLYPKLVNGALVEKTQEELKLELIIPLVDGEIIEDGKLITKEKPLGYKIEWVSPNWIETATDEEIAEIILNESISFYNEELTFASKATAELACTIISELEFEDVKAYMKAIDPYSVTKLTRPPRPSIFDKYK
ncbi:MAG: hypothetical protein ACRC6U_02895 [Fusobacteriaceae bacterium]